ncbi:MAG: hypothetical protein LUG86_09670 [Oscillospiraceae bacterium]|nr:hypothetical protein [Oscillospiraceae bacterium]
MQLTVSDIIEIVSILVAFITSITAIIISILTLRQNNKMLEESTRPQIAIYGAMLHGSNRADLYLVVRNFGMSSATFSKFAPDFDFSNCYLPDGEIRSTKDYIADLAHCTIAPGQSRVCRLEYSKITRPVTFTLEFSSPQKTYKEQQTVDLRLATGLPVAGIGSKKDPLESISLTLQEMLRKEL